MTDLLFLYQSMSMTIPTNKFFFVFFVPGGAKLWCDPEVLLCSLPVTAEHTILLFMSLVLGSFFECSELTPH